MQNSKALIKDTYNSQLKGRLIFKIYKNGELIETIDEKNLVVNQSREFMRNLVFGNTDNVITQFKIGDMNKTLSDDLSDLEQPLTTDTDLVNTFFTKTYEDKSLYTDSNTNSPGIQYHFLILEDEANDPNNQDYKRKLWCEYALADGNGNIWTRKVKPIIKDNETRIEIYYILTF